MDRPTDAFLIQVAILLHQFGTPSHRLERVMIQMARSLGVEGVFLYTPTALVIAITDEEGERTYLRRVNSGAEDVDKLIRFDETLEQVESKKLTLKQASAKLQTIAESPPLYPAWISCLACAISSAAVAIFFRGSATEVFAAGCIGLTIALLDVLTSRLDIESGLLQPVAGFVAAFSSLAFAKYVTPVDDRLVTLAALIVLIPGLRITVALTELAVGHLSSGGARLAGACVSLLTITIGVGLGWRAAESWRSIPQLAEQLANYWQWLAIVVAPITFAVVFKARWPQWPVISAVTIAGFVTSLLFGQEWGVEVGAFCGALVVGTGSNLYARLRDRPAMVTLTPGIIVLVPGSLGYRSLTAFLDHETLAGVDFAFGMIVVAAALVGGILTANVILPPKRIL